VAADTAGGAAGSLGSDSGSGVLSGGRSMARESYPTPPRSVSY
jgi:hypothetical protein